jgi:thiaminase (transcriptional activator TenA)
MNDRKLTARLSEAGMPIVTRHLQHPTVVALSRGDLPDSAARAWLAQDYLFLLDETRMLSRLAWQAPMNHRQDLIDLAWGVLHEEIPNHKEVCARFGADLEGARKSPECASYTSWLLESAADYGIGLVALLSGLWGYSTLGRLMQLPEEPRLRQWVESYKSPEFASLAKRFADMVDETPVDAEQACDVFVAGLQHGLDFWDISR